MNNPSASVAPPVRARTAPDLPRPPSGEPSPAPRRIAPRPDVCQAPLPRSSAARPARDRESPGRARSVLPRAPVASCGRSAGAEGGGSSRRVPARERRSRQARPRRRASGRPSMGATTSAAPPGLASRRAGTRIDSRTACSFTRAVPKSRLHCCSFRKLMPGASSPPAGAAARAASAFGCTSTSPTRCSSFSPWP